MEFVRVYDTHHQVLSELRRVLEPFVIRLLELEYLLIDGWLRSGLQSQTEGEGK